MKPGIDYDGFKLRMRFGEWFLDLWKGEVDTQQQLGPFTFAEAKAFASRHRLKDIEKDYRRAGE